MEHFHLKVPSFVQNLQLSERGGGGSKVFNDGTSTTGNLGCDLCLRQELVGKESTETEGFNSTAELSGTGPSTCPPPFLAEGS